MLKAWRGGASPARMDERVAYLITDILSDNIARASTFGEGSALHLSRSGGGQDRHDHRLARQLDGGLHARPGGGRVGRQRRQRADAPRDRRDRRGSHLARRDGRAAQRPPRARVPEPPAWCAWRSARTVGCPAKSVRAVATRSRPGGRRPGGVAGTGQWGTCGGKATVSCPRTIDELFIEGTQPTRTDDWHWLYRIDTRNGLLAGPSVLAAVPRAAALHALSGRGARVGAPAGHSAAAGAVFVAVSGHW